MKSRLAVALILIAPLAFAGTGKISGIVVDESGVAVTHMRVEAFPIGGGGSGWSGAVPGTITDEHGRFVISVPIAGGRLWRVYPLQEDRYYPALDALFYQTENNHGEIVELAEGTSATVQLKLGQQAGALTPEVRDANTGVAIRPVDFRLAWATEPNHGLTATIIKGNRSILLPSNTDVNLTVQAPGYTSWTYPGVINVGPGQDLPLDVELQRANTTSR